MIELLRANAAVVGLAEYGSASYTDSRIHGDYDLIVIIDPGIPSIESLHFYVGDTPVDLNLRTLEQIDAMGRADGFESILLDSRIIHDPSGEARRALDDLRGRHEASDRTAMGQERIAAMRHGAKHTFDKLRGGRNLPPLLKRYMLHQCVYWAVPHYFEIRGLQYRGEKHALAYLRENEPHLLECLDRFYSTTDPHAQEQLAGTIQEVVLAPVGGLWQNDELLAFGDQSKGQHAFQALFGEAVSAQRGDSV